VRVPATAKDGTAIYPLPVFLSCTATRPLTTSAWGLCLASKKAIRRGWDELALALRSWSRRQNKNSGETDALESE